MLASLLTGTGASAVSVYRSHLVALAVTAISLPLTLKSLATSVKCSGKTGVLYMAAAGSLLIVLNPLLNLFIDDGGHTLGLITSAFTISGTGLLLSASVWAGNLHRKAYSWLSARAGDCGSWCGGRAEHVSL